MLCNFLGYTGTNLYPCIYNYNLYSLYYEFVIFCNQCFHSDWWLISIRPHLPSLPLVFILGVATSLSLRSLTQLVLSDLCMEHFRVQPAVTSLNSAVDKVHEQLLTKLVVPNHYLTTDTNRYHTTVQIKRQGFKLFNTSFSQLQSFS